MAHTRGRQVKLRKYVSRISRRHRDLSMDYQLGVTLGWRDYHADERLALWHTLIVLHRMGYLSRRDLCHAS